MKFHSLSNLKKQRSLQLDFEWVCWLGKYIIFMEKNKAKKIP